MGRWQPGARDRLERAALELFAERGFAETTVPQITARAGLTTRTFFRHFADKREVLFAREEELPDLVAGLIAGAPASLGPMDVIIHAFDAGVSELFEGRIEYLRARRAVVSSDGGLRERELRKFDVLTEAAARGFRDRGAGELTAALSARLAVTVFSVALTRWLDAGGDRELRAFVAETLDALKCVVAG